MKEDYSNARTLATVEHLGVTFRVCRKRVNGKPWRKYLCLVKGALQVATDAVHGGPAIEDADTFAAWAKVKLEKAYPAATPTTSKEMLLDKIAELESADK